MKNVNVQNYANHYSTLKIKKDLRNGELDAQGLATTFHGVSVDRTLRISVPSIHLQAIG